jgi:protein-disulfide isomerase
MSLWPTNALSFDRAILSLPAGRDRIDFALFIIYNINKMKLKIFLSVCVIIAILIVISVKNYQGDNSGTSATNTKDGTHFTQSKYKNTNKKSTGSKNKILQAVIDNSNAIHAPKDAVITIVEFSAFECPYSKQAFPIIREILANYPDQIKYIYKHFLPSESFPNAQKAAEASECANDQKKFFAMHDKLFQNQDRLTITDIKYYAKTIGLDEQRFSACLDSGKYASRVQKDMETGISLGVAGTPTWFINGRKIDGVIPLDLFKKAIESIL